MNRKKLIVAAALSCVMFAGCGNITSGNSADNNSSLSMFESDSPMDEPSMESDDTSTDVSDSDDTSTDASDFDDTSTDTSDSDNTSPDDSSSDNINPDEYVPDDITSYEEQSKITMPTYYNYEYFSDDLFIGDSIFTGLSLYGILDKSNVAASVGNSIAGAHYNTLSNYNGTAVDYAEEMQPTHINIMLGSNMLGPGVSLTGLVNDYKSLINALETACPNSEICIVSVPPITENSSLAKSAGITKTTIDSANDYIKEMCEELEIRYFDLNTALSDNNGYFKAEYAEVDGFHFKKAAYDVLLFGLETQ
ncbi:MAG: hypothetical protein K2N06_01220 [Oscillospiraceae bacterium]|nr:hypothetical protein [Oscillospiraceae bacterium]